MNSKSSDNSGSPGPLISVITVCRNAEAFIEQCIKSVLAQQFEGYEYLIIDGGSTDATVKIIERNQSRLSYWHSRPDRGLAHAFNLGIENSTGKWLLFLNSDDYFVDSSVLNKMAAHLEDNPESDVVYGQVMLIRRQAEAMIIGGPYGRRFKWREFLLRDTIPHPAAFTSRGFFERLGRFNERFGIAMDYELYLRAGAGLKTKFIPYIMTYMRAGGISRQNVRSVLREWRIAQIINATVPRYWVWVLFIYLSCRSRLGLVCRFVKNRGKQ